MCLLYTNTMNILIITDFTLHIRDLKLIALKSVLISEEADTASLRMENSFKKPFTIINYI